MAKEFYKDTVKSIGVDIVIEVIGDTVQIATQDKGPLYRSGGGAR